MALVAVMSFRAWPMRRTFMLACLLLAPPVVSKPSPSKRGDTQEFTRNRRWVRKAPSLATSLVALPSSALQRGLEAEGAVRDHDASAAGQVGTANALTPAVAKLLRSREGDFGPSSDVHDGPAQGGGGEAKGTPMRWQPTDVDRGTPTTRAPTRDDESEPKVEPPERNVPSNGGGKAGSGSKDQSPQIVPVTGGGKAERASGKMGSGQIESTGGKPGSRPTKIVQEKGEPAGSSGDAGSAHAKGPKGHAERGPKGETSGRAEHGQKGGAQAQSEGKAEEAEEGILDPAQEWMQFRSLLYVVPIMVGAAIIFEWVHKRYAGLDWGLAVEYPAELGNIGLRGYTGDATGWIAEYILSPGDRLKRNIILATLIFSIFFQAYLNFCWTTWMGRWYELIQFPRKNRASFSPLFVNFLILVVVDTIRSVYTGYVSSWFMIDWHTWMTRRFQRLWLSDQAFYLMEIVENREEFDNPDQRISEDAINFCNSTWSLFSGVLASVLDLMIYVPMLWRLSPRSVFGLFECKGWLVYLAIAWAFCGTVLVHYVGRILIALKYASQRYHADYRFALVNVRTNSESIAMLGAEEVEGENLTSQWQRIRRITWEGMMFNKRFNTVMALYQHSAKAITLVILMPAYLSGEILLGAMRMAEDALSSVKSDFEFFVNSYGELTDFRASVARLKALEKKKELACQLGPTFRGDGGVPPAPADGGASGAESGSAGGAGDAWSGAGGQPLKPPRARADYGDSFHLSVQGLRVLLPSGLLLVELVEELDVLPGSRVLISGPVGSGKSKLLRALADVWPHASLAPGGHFCMPPRERCLFVPRVRVLPNGSLADAISYPDVPGTYSDDDLLNAIEVVGLGSVLLRGDSCMTEGNKSKREAAPSSAFEAPVMAQPIKPSPEATKSEKLAALKTAADWSRILSGGEQQRVIIAHVFLKKPSLVFLDESTSSMSREMAGELYARVLDAIGPNGAMVSITHDVDGLRPFHNVHMAMDPQTKSLVAAP